MQDWSEGYVSDIGYTFGYYPALNHVNARLPLLNKGIQLPQISNVCELGFGQGISINMHAAASECKYYGTDFSPTQVNFAKRYSKNSGAELYDESFEKFCKRSDLPKFDFISLHGIWSWISRENRTHILNFFRDKLNVGGIVYISYNTYPGWSMFAPMRNLMSQHSEILGSPGGNSDLRVSNAVEFVETVLATNPLYLRENPSINPKIEDLKALEKSYLAHEYFNQNWKPDYFSEIAKDLESAKLEYVCSSRVFDQLNSLCFTADQNKLLNAIESVTLRECVKDIMRNCQFRQEYWIKGPIFLPPHEQQQAVKRERFLLTAPESELSRKYNSPIGEFELDETLFNTVIKVFSDHKVHSIGEAAESIRSTKFSLAEVLDVIIILIDAGKMIAVKSAESISLSEKACDSLNDQIVQSSRSREDISWLASPVSGGGIGASRVDQLIITAISEGLVEVAEIVDFVHDILNEQGHSIIVHGKLIEDEGERKEHLNSLVPEFIGNRLPILKSLKVMP